MRKDAKFIMNGLTPSSFLLPFILTVFFQAFSLLAQEVAPTGSLKTVSEEYSVLDKLDPAVMYQYEVDSNGKYYWKDARTKSKKPISSKELVEEKELWMTSIQHLISKYKDTDKKRKFFIVWPGDNKPDSSFIKKLREKGAKIRKGGKGRTNYAQDIVEEKGAQIGDCRISIDGVNWISETRASILVSIVGLGLGSSEIILEKTDNNWKVIGEHDYRFEILVGS